MSIVVFDSGLGGVTVLHKALQVLPYEQYIYFADDGHVPYGTKTKEEVRSCILASMEATITDETRALVVACNTATSIAIGDLRKRYGFPVIGMEPAVKPAVELSRSTGRRVLVLATALTLREAKYHDLVNRLGDSGRIDSLPMPGLVTLAEELVFTGPRVQAYLDETLGGYDWTKYGTIVLGCTHFQFFRTALAAFLPPHVELIDGSAGTVRRLQELIGSGEAVADSPGSIEFRHSGSDAGYPDKMRHALDWYRRDRSGQTHD
ncbi:glutamate racemase [Gorillibacterium timonense]|uniref:glutamate racemase n=1 Tax=Gorillibacterium timonense TaxID=1689269 RepID=UPI00071D9C41|nr:glutamate racemase [Gorillibacterium timonense]